MTRAERHWLADLIVGPVFVVVTVLMLSIRFPVLAGFYILLGLWLTFPADE